MNKIAMVMILLLFMMTGCSIKENTQMQTTPIESSTKEQLQAQPASIKESMKITFFKLGNADSILFEIGDKTMLIDTGEDGDGSRVSAVLKDRQIQKIDYMIISHFDKDHVGGAARILKRVKTDNVIQPSYTKDSEGFNRYQEALTECGIKPVNLTEEFGINLNGAEIKVFPTSDLDHADDNNASLITEVKYGSKTFLFAGDAKSVRLAEHMNTSPRKFDFLKVPHHGRVNNLSRKFLESISPQYGVICCGGEKNDTYEVSKILEELGTGVYYTCDGMITLLCDGEEIVIKQNG